MKQDSNPHSHSWRPTFWKCSEEGCDNIISDTDSKNNKKILCADCLYERYKSRKLEYYYRNKLNVGAKVA